MQQVKNIELLIIVDVKNLKAQRLNLGLLLDPEGCKLLNKVIDCDFVPMVALSHPEVEHLAEIGFVDTDHVLDILCEVFLGQHIEAITVRLVLDTIFLVGAPDEPLKNFDYVIEVSCWHTLCKHGSF